MFYTARMCNLNSAGYENTPFGVSTPESDARLLSRRIFRAEGGVENGIPIRQRALHGRRHERDIAEGLTATDYANFNYAHDMSSLHRRIDNAAQSRQWW